MQLLKYIPLQLLLCLIFGIVIDYYANFSLEAVFVALLVSLIVLLVSFVFYRKGTRNSLFNLATFLVFFSIGLASIAFQNDIIKKDHFINSVPEKGNVDIILKITSVLKPSTYYRKYEAEVLKMNTKQTQGRLLVSIKKDSLINSFHIDDTFLISTALLEIEEPKNPYQFNYKKYLKRRHIYKQITIRNDEAIQLKNDHFTLKGYAHKFRIRVNETLIKNGFGGDELAIINALLLGQRQEISKELIQDYSEAGAIHILAVSGLHVGIIMLLLSFLTRPLKYFKRGKNIQIIIVILLLWVFAFVAGMSPSVIRAVAMFTAVSIGLAVKRKNSVYKNLILSMFFLLLFNPYYLFEIGFQLSYVAVFFIVWLQPIIYKLWKPKWKVLDYFWQLFTVSLAAQIGVLPLSLYYFHQFPGLFFVANLAIVPILGFVLGLGILVIFLGWMNLVPDILLSFYNVLIKTMNNIISWIAEQESFLFQEISFSILLVFSSYIFVIFVFRWIQDNSVKNLTYTLFAIILLQGVFLYQRIESKREKAFIVFNQNRASVLGLKEGNTLHVASTVELEMSQAMLSDYKTGREIHTTKRAENFSDIYKVNGNNIVVVDSLSIYRSTSLKIDKILLTNSPKINLERLIEEVEPALIIADGSNYKSYAKRWQKTCAKRNVAFHYTGEDGAYIEKW